MKIADILQKTHKEIESEILNLRREILNLNFQKAAGELANYSRFKIARRMIARYKTALMQKMNLNDLRRK